MAGKFEIKTSKSGKVSFNLKASNGQVILSSESYDSRKGAEGGIASVKKNAGNDGRFERKTAKDGSAFFVLKAANGEPIGKSEMYKTKRSMENGIASVGKNAPDAPVTDAKYARHLYTFRSGRRACPASFFSHDHQTHTPRH
jgi:uncharacterized protein